MNRGCGQVASPKGKPSRGTCKQDTTPEPLLDPKGNAVLVAAAAIVAMCCCCVDGTVYSARTRRRESLPTLGKYGCAKEAEYSHGVSGSGESSRDGARA